MQGIDGGFHTGYSSNLTYAGTGENVETTAIAIIGLSEQRLGPNMLGSEILLGGAIMLLLLLAVLRKRTTITSVITRP